MEQVSSNSPCVQFSSVQFYAKVYAKPEGVHLKKLSISLSLCVCVCVCVCAMET